MQDTLFLSSKNLSKLVHAVGLENFFKGMRAQIESDFRRWHEFDKSPRTANHSEIGVIELMPISDMNKFAFKYVNGHPKNTRLNIPTIMAFNVLADMNNGIPLLISEATFLTAFRTACTSVFVAQLLARKNSQSMAVIGNGAQSEFQILAFYFLMGINNFRLYDIDKDASLKLVDNLKPFLDIQLTICESTQEAVRDVDIITTITADKCNSVIIDETMIRPGQHLNAVGGDCPGKTELAKNVLKKANIFVEYLPQTRVEGEIQQLNDGELKITELWEVLENIKQGRTSNEEITLFDSVGFALEDYSAIMYVYQLLQTHCIAKKLDLIPYSKNPKNLFGQLYESN